MLSFAAGFLFGVVLVFQLTSLPTAFFVLPIAVITGFLFRHRWWLPAGIAAGFCWALIQAQWNMAHQLPEDLAGVDQTLVVRVVGLPRTEGRKVRFTAETVTSSAAASTRMPRRLLLSWYRPCPHLEPGELWQLQVRLKRPRSFANPGSFDYAGWLYQQGVDASGYVRKSPANRKLREAAPSIDQWRMHLAARIDSQAEHLSQAGLIKALALGIRQDVDQQQWQTLIRTGTNHLLAISGLHIGLVAAIGFLLARGLWRLFPRLCLWLPMQRAGALFALVPASLYAALAGFAIPTQRALIMLAVVSAGLLFWRQLRPWSVLAVALLMVLLRDTGAVMAAGFWLSFLAVAAILALSQWHRFRGWRLLLVLQLVLMLALLPVTASYFGRASLISPLANLLAVPVVSLVAVPLVLSGVLLGELNATVGDWLLGVADRVLSWLMLLLDYLAALPWAAFAIPVAGSVVLLCLMLAVMLMLLPRGIPGRWLLPVFLLPAMAGNAQQLSPGSYRVSVLDVGQGLAVVVATADHLLVYDTGARFSRRSTAARSVVIPYLRYLGASRIDTLVLSHDDNDHAGGENDLLDAMPVGQRFKSGARRESRDAVATRDCVAGVRWQWDGVDFEFLHPPRAWPVTDNNRSCVLKIGNGVFSTLLPGDIERPVEAFLLGQQRDRLPSTLLVAPHHGSLTSSSTDFIAGVEPRWTVFSVGYRNRFGFPREEVVARYHARGGKTLRTDQSGMVSFRFGDHEDDVVVQTWRGENLHWWQKTAVRKIQ